MTGWLSPKGVFYPCKKQQHADCINTLYKNGLCQYEGEIFAEKAGWIKIRKNLAYSFYMPNQMQIGWFLSLEHPPKLIYNLIYITLEELIKLNEKNYTF